MRRALRRQLPAFSHHFGIQPWDIDRLTYGELDLYLEQLRELAKEAKTHGHT